MRVVVADATPLHYLILVGAIQILPSLFKRIHAPVQVRDELISAAAPSVVRNWMQQPPDWLEILVITPEPAEAVSLAGLDLGERAAILLAESIRADLLLIDDRAGAAAARHRGLTVTGTLGVLDLASQARLLNLLSVFERLQKTNFRYPASVIETLLEAERKRRKEQS